MLLRLEHFNRTCYINDPTSELRLDQNGNTPEAPRTTLHRLNQPLPDFRIEADAAHEARVSGMALGALSGLTTLNRELSRAYASGVHALYGNTGNGKTALALQIAAQCQCPALFMTCEMSLIEPLRRLTANFTSILLGDLKSGALRGQDSEDRARRAIAQAPALAFVDATRAAVTPAYLRDCAQIVKAMCHICSSP